jgi:hypothetical protein
MLHKKLTDSLAINANAYVDMISSASIDVVTQASPYKETRRQQSLNAEYLHDKSTYTFGYISSVEPDFNSKTGFFSISESMFGDLTNVSFGYTGGWDKVGKVDKGVVEAFSADADRRNWQIGVSQVLTRTLLLDLNFETAESEGYLHSPYRSVRYIDPTVARGYSYQPEVYPDTRTGNAASVQLKYYLPYRAALDGSYRFYRDTWGIVADTLRVDYTQPVRNWTLDALVRFYHQSHANFYSDLFPYANSQNFMARDRELAQFDSLTLGVGATWDFRIARAPWLDKGTLNFSFDRLLIDYADFRNALVTGVPPHDEPLYRLDASIMQFFISAWF